MSKIIFTTKTSKSSLCAGHFQFPPILCEDEWGGDAVNPSQEFFDFPPPQLAASLF